MQLDGSAEMDFDAELGQHGGLGGEGAVGLLRGFGVGDVDVVCVMARHELVARDAVQQDVHDGPLRGDGLQAALGLGGGKFDGGGAADVCMQLAALG